jgi:hypothetical protein
MPRLALCVLLAAFAGTATAPSAPPPASTPAPTSKAAEKPAYDPIEHYKERRIEGWKVLVHRDLLTKEHRELGDETLKLLGDHLYRITRAVPAAALARLRKVPIWVERAHPKHPCMCYHISEDWLRQNGMNPKKAGAVEVANARTFLEWTHEQPWMVLHELAHAYHHQVLGFDHKGVKACYDAAVEAKTYESVLHINGRKVRHYALTNEKEYFAETTEAYFGTNDYYPFVRAELKRHDPRGYELMEKVWGVRKREKK